MQSPWIVYVLRSDVDGRLYTGITDNIVRRLRTHNEGKGAKATRPWRPWKVAYIEHVASKSAALKREAAIKKLPRAKKLVLIGA